MIGVLLLINCFVCLYVNVWSAENEPFEEFATLKILETLSSSRMLWKACPYYIPIYPITKCILITSLFIVLH
jgi:hypothetical protein